MRTFENVEQIKAERQAQRDNPVVYSLLGVVLGEPDRLPTRANPTADQIYAIVKKLYEAAEFIASKDLDDDAKTEYAYLKNFIKEQLSRSEIEIIITELLLQAPSANIGVIMKHFKDNYAGQYDGKAVSQIAKEIINQ